MVVISAVATTLYLGGWYFPFVYKLEVHGWHNLYVIVSFLVFVVKLSLILYLYFWLRWTLPRFRYDQLMDIGWKWLIPSALINICFTAFSVFLVQAVNGWHGIRTIESMSQGLNLTASGKVMMILLGLAGLFLNGVVLSMINLRSRGFHLKSPRRNIWVVSVPSRTSAVASSQGTPAATQT